MVVPFERPRLDTGNSRTFEVTDTEGVTRTVPRHRVRRIYLETTGNDEPIWSRPA